jgi:hypothetical protein
MENGESVNPTISTTDVISKLKDDGDFDRLRLKIVRKLKENEELRNKIMSAVRQSAALNRPGAENMKPRQLSDDIHDEIGENVMSQISDGIWDIIRSADGMKTEINDTVKSVYYKLSSPIEDSKDVKQPSPTVAMPRGKGPENSGPLTATLDDSTPIGSNEPPRFVQPNAGQNNPEEGLNSEEHMDEVRRSDDDNLSAPAGFSMAVDDHKQPCDDGSDEDPDLPPGFGG